MPLSAGAQHERLIRLHPVQTVREMCPSCGKRLAVAGWAMPGMRALAKLNCSDCSREFAVDMAVGHGLYYPAMLELSTGALVGPTAHNWFGTWLSESYAARSSRDVPIRVETLRAIRGEPVILNALDGLYGHALLKLLNAQYHVDVGDELIVIVPEWLRWLVPEGASEVWSIPLAPGECRGWYTKIDQRIHERVETLRGCYLSPAFPHPATTAFDIKRFTRVTPFSLDSWDRRPADPVVTYIWRPDRSWRRSARSELRSITRLCRELRRHLPTADLAVAGVGEPGGLPSFIDDRRVPRAMLTEDVERAWCVRYAKSHVVVGVHGSNMLLPSALAGAVLELLPDDRLGNLAQDVLARGEDPSDVLLRYRFLPSSSPFDAVAGTLVSMVRDYHELRTRALPQFADHGRFAGLSRELRQDR